MRRRSRATLQPLQSSGGLLFCCLLVCLTKGPSGHLLNARSCMSGAVAAPVITASEARRLITLLRVADGPSGPHLRMDTAPYSTGMRGMLEDGSELC